MVIGPSPGKITALDVKIPWLPPHPEQRARALASNLPSSLARAWCSPAVLWVQKTHSWHWVFVLVGLSAWSRCPTGSSVAYPLTWVKFLLKNLSGMVTPACPTYRSCPWPSPSPYRALFQAIPAIIYLFISSCCLSFPLECEFYEAEAWSLYFDRHCTPNTQNICYKIKASYLFVGKMNGAKW